MNKPKAITALLLITLGIAFKVSAAPPTSGAYVEDEQRFYTEGQAVTKDIADANAVVCYLSSMSPVSFIGDGPYQAKIYQERCQGSGANAKSEEAAATASPSQSSTSSTGGNAASEIETETSLLATVSVQPLAESSVGPNAAQPMKVSGWIDLKAANAESMDLTVYLDAEILEGTSAASPNGVFTKNWTFYTKGLPNWFLQGDVADEEMPDGALVNLGYLAVSGNEIKYRDVDLAGDYDDINVSLEYLEGGNITGIYADTVYVSPEGEDGRTFRAFSQFFVDTAKKRVCNRVNEVYQSWPWEPISLEDFGSLVESDPWLSIDLEEGCYSTLLADTQRNVFRYGVYTEEGARASTTVDGTRSAFPIFADVEVEVVDPDDEGVTTTTTERVFGYADYWGVYIDPRGALLVDSETEFKAENFSDEDSTNFDEYFKVAGTEVRVEKRTKSYVALNDLNKLKLAMHVQDGYWSSEFTALLGVDVFSAEAFEEYEGYFDAAEQRFVFEKGVRFNPEYELTVLPTPITFTPTEWISKMRKVEDYGWVDEQGIAVLYTDVRGLGVWSNDTRQWYDISPAALKDPTLAEPAGEAPEFFDPFDSSRGGITRESTEFVSPADVPGDLVCIQDCLTPAKVQETFIYGYCAQNRSGDPDNCAGFIESELGAAPSPFTDAGPFLAEDVTVVRIYEDPNATNLLDNFYLSNPDNALARDGFKLATGNAQIVDHVYIPVNEDQGVTEEKTLEKRVAITKIGRDSEQLWLQAQGSLDAVNLNRLIAGEGGKAPVVTFDLQSAPAIGDTGTTMVELIIQRDLNETGKELKATVPVDWEGTTSGFQLTVAEGAVVTLGYKSDSTSVSASGTNPSKLVLGYTGGVATNRGRPGLNLKLLSLFNGDTWNLVGLQSPSFFEPDAFYNVIVNFSDGFTFHELEDPEQRLSSIYLSSIRTTPGSDEYSIERFTKGQWWDGILASSLVRYKPNNLGFDVGGSPLSKGDIINEFLREIEDPWSAFGETTYFRPEGWQERISYGLRTGRLVAEEDLSKLECNKDADGVYEDHPAFKGNEESETRYCTQKLNELTGLTTYTISLDPQPSYALLDASGEPVNIAAPLTMYYEVPDEADFGADRGKRLSLEFAGHGELRGVPGFVYDTVTGEDKGEYVNDWQDQYRYLSRFTIPDGSVITDLAGVEYYVKALDGEQWLKKLDDSASAELQYTFTVDDLTPGYLLKDLDDTESPDYLGERPTCDDADNAKTCALLNNGKPAVTHGELVPGADPTPSSD
jgi:hypothetical protein